MKKTATTSQKHAKQSLSTTSSKLNVSKNFYASISDRVAETCKLLPDSKDTAKEAMSVIDRYIGGEKVNLKNLNANIQLIFTLLRSEIDRALSRSKAARLRGLQRRRNLQEKEARFIESLKAMCGATAMRREDTEMPEAESLSTPAQTMQPNRRQRRRELREEKRAMRQRIKRIG
ncbi:hypothetical protein [uncultured Duncaniella sp.]|uniref:hypothetical protein n=1 Tax=uncultured Duncaniella sp. TaxID=2768039 RepID=UPI0025D31232|nr:hypothetical protein [uncultured Duncaniella sp.]